MVEMPCLGSEQTYGAASKILEETADTKILLDLTVGWAVKLMVLSSYIVYRLTHRYREKPPSLYTTETLNLATAQRTTCAASQMSMISLIAVWA